MLGFGTILVQTFVGDLVIDKVHHPAKVQEKIIKIMKELGLYVLRAGIRRGMTAKKTKKRTSRLKAKFKKKTKRDEPNKPDEVSAPRITNETVAEHREEVLGGARRFIYPLQHSKHRIVIISAALIVLLLLAVLFSTYWLLYRTKSTSDITYRITQILPFPVAKVNGGYVPYENYLFEIRHTPYTTDKTQQAYEYENDGEKINKEVARQALAKVKLDALAEQIARGQ